MKIGILTQPLHDNYGGLLQAYALKEVLKEMGHEVIIINRKKKAIPRWRKYASIAKSILIGRKVSQSLFLKQSFLNEISKNTIKFRNKYFPELSTEIFNQEGMERLNSVGFDAYVVGSDQCWRPLYSPAIRNYFLDFAVNDTHVKRISYAASFGVSHWEFTDKDTEACRKLIKKFDAISVREHSAIELLKNNLGRDDAVHVVDPTMLLSKEQYTRISANEEIPKSKGNLKVYILDRTEEKDAIVNHFRTKYSFSSFEVLPKKRLGSVKVDKRNINDFVYPNPAKWIRGFQDAEFVITDSFHGTVFSILFNVPFITIGNKNRGMARFESLLNMFNLKDRLVEDYSEDIINNIVKNDIDWKEINILLEIEQKKALNFLNKNLH